VTPVATLAPVWVTARAAGTAALLSSSLALSAGLLMALKPKVLRRGRVELRAAHEAFALATMALIVVHGLAICFDPYLRPGVVQTVVPFAAHYKTLGTALGQVAAYGLLALGGTFYARRRLGGQRWRRAHRVIPVFWAVALGHALLTGTDAYTWWFAAAAALPVLSGVALLAARLAPAEEPASPASAAANASTS
jgi:methionine sulfoxide reductase heme-binding subunit